MHPISLRGGSSVAASVYRELHSGHMVYMDTAGVLPGQMNSETYVEVAQAALFNHRSARRPVHARPDIRPA